MGDDSQQVFYDVKARWFGSEGHTKRGQDASRYLAAGVPPFPSWASLRASHDKKNGNQTTSYNMQQYIELYGFVMSCLKKLDASSFMALWFENMMLNDLTCSLTTGSHGATTGLNEAKLCVATTHREILGAVPCSAWFMLNTAI